MRFAHHWDLAKMVDLLHTKAMRRLICMTVLCFMFWSVHCLAENYVLVEQMGSEIRYELQQRVTRGSDTDRVELCFVVPQSVPVILST